MSATEPLNAQEVAALEDVARGDTASAIAIRRLVATVRAREAERDEQRAEAEHQRLITDERLTRINEVKAERDAARAEVQRYREREALFIATLEVLGPIADGGQYRNDVVARILRLGRVARAWKALAQARGQPDYVLAYDGDENARRAAVVAEGDALKALAAEGVDPDGTEGT